LECQFIATPRAAPFADVVKEGDRIIAVGFCFFPWYCASMKGICGSSYLLI